MFFNIPLNNKTGENCKLYKEKRLLVNKVVRTAKEKSWNEFGDKLEKDSKGNQKLFYKVMKSLRTEKAVTIRNAKGAHDRREEKIDTYEYDDIETGDNREEISLEELKEVIKNLKNGKATGHDKVNNEMLKNMGEAGIQLLWEIYKKAWKEQKIPKD